MSHYPKVIIIDPKNRIVRADRVPLDLKTLQTLVGGYIECIYPDALGGETLYLNEEGKLKPNYHFQLLGFPDILAGPCLVVGVRDGVETDTAWTPEEVEMNITWRPDLDGRQLLR